MPVTSPVASVSPLVALAVEFAVILGVSRPSEDESPSSDMESLLLSPLLTDLIISLYGSVVEPVLMMLAFTSPLVESFILCSSCSIVVPALILIL